MILILKSKFNKEAIKNFRNSWFRDLSATYMPLDRSYDLTMPCIKKQSNRVEIQYSIKAEHKKFNNIVSGWTVIVPRALEPLDDKAWSKIVKHISKKCPEIK